jgi:hypothetical protein
MTFKNHIPLFFFFMASLCYSQTKNVSNVTQFLNELEDIRLGTSSTTEIVLQENNYNLTSEIALTDAHDNITISGCGNVLINGGVVLDNDNFVSFSESSAGFTPNDSNASAHIIVYDLTTLGISASDLGSFNHHGFSFSDDFDTPSMLWLDEDKMDLARWPNDGEVVSTDDLIIPSNWEDLRSEVSGAVSYENILETGTAKSSSDGVKFTLNSARNAKIASWEFFKTSQEKIWMDGVLHSSWEWEYNQVQSIESSQIKMQYGSNTPFTISNVDGKMINSATKVSHFHFENIPEELDAEGEYFIDRGNMKLYFYPPVNWETKQITLSTLNSDMLSIKNASGITLENITFQAGLKNGIIIENSSDILIDNSIIRNFNQWGVRIIGENNTVNNCELYNLGAGGVKLGLENKTFHLSKENNVVQHSVIRNFAYDQKSQVPGITLSGCGNKAMNNEIFDAPHFAVKFRQSRGCVLEGNKIHDLPKYHHFDGGAVYLGLGINFQNRENLIKNNTISNVPTNGIYLDNYTNGNFVEGNVLYNIGNSTDGANYGAIYNHGGGQNTYKDNVAIDCAVFIKTGSHIVKGDTANTWKYLQPWFNSVQSGQGFYKPSGAYYTDFITEYAASDLETFIDYLSDLPAEVETYLPTISSLSDWQDVKEDWDLKGYNAMKDEGNTSGLSEWLQWRNYFRVRYQSSTITNNVSLNTDIDKLPSGGTGTWGGVTLGDSEVFWEYSPYFEYDGSNNKVDYISLHIAQDNQALSNADTSNLFPNLIVDGAINETTYPTFTHSSAKLASQISLPLSSRGDANSVSFSDCPIMACSGIELQSFSFQEEAGCDGAVKNESYTTITKNTETDDYTIDVSEGTDSLVFSLFFLVDWDSNGMPNGPFDPLVASMADSDIIEFVGDHAGFEISSVDKISAPCWNWNRRVNIDLTYTGTDYDTTHELELTFNPNNNLVSKNGELYCPQKIKMLVNMNQPELSVNETKITSSRLYPNPMQQVLTIENTQKIQLIELYDTFGQRLRVQQCDSKKNQMQLSDLNSGTYVVRIQSSQGTEVFQVVKN